MVAVTAMKSREHLLLDAVNLESIADGYAHTGRPTASRPTPASKVPTRVSDVDLQIQKLEAWLEQRSGSLPSAIRLPAHRALIVLKELSKEFLNCGFELPTPLAAPGEDSGFLLSWDRGSLHLEVEFDSGEVAQWFLWERGTDFSWQRDIGDPPGYDKSVLAWLCKLSMFPVAQASPEPARPVFVATPEDQEFLTRLLSDSPAPTPALVRLMSGPRLS
jgi:hypothetical protein